MNRDEFSTLVGGTLSHFTPAPNLRGITALGLMPPATAAERAGKDPSSLVLRKDPLLLTSQDHTIRLNHQMPLRAGANATFLEGHTLSSWAAQLDRRLFFWPARGGAAFCGSLPDGTHRLDFDARRMFDAFADHLWLSPINSGNATRRPALRGDWLYVSARSPAHALRHNRKTRGLIKGTDTVVEVSLTCSIPPDAFESLLR